MRIHHIAVYVRDMAVVSEFIEKYFEANRICITIPPQGSVRVSSISRMARGLSLCIGQMSRSHMIPCCMDVMAVQQCSHWKTDSKLLM